MARRSGYVLPLDPIDDAMREDRQTLADNLTEALAQLSDVEQGALKGILYRIPIPNGKYEWIRDVYPAAPPSPPFDMSDIMRSLKEEIGGGDYALRLMADNKVRRTVHFSIMRDRVDPAAAAKKDEGTSLSMFQLMMTQQADSRREAQASADRQMQMMQQANQQTMQMFAAMSSQTTAILTAMMANREKVTDLVPLFSAMQPPQGGMKDAVETLVALKGLLPGEGGGGGFDPDDLVGSAVKLAGPLLAAGGRMLQQRQAAGHEALAEPAQALALPGAPGPLQLTMNPAPDDPVERVLRHIRDDVLFMFRRYDPELAAEAVYARIEAAGVGEQELNDLVAAFYASPDWIEDLAARGLDLRSDRAWAADFLQGLVAVHTSPVPGGGDDHTGGNGGSTPDAGEDGAPGAGGIAAH